MKKVFLALSIVFSVSVVHAQVTSTSVWKWVAGDSILDSHGRYGVKGVADSTNSPRGRNGGRTWTDAAGAFWLFGGNGPGSASNTKLNDLWKYSPVTGQWTWVSGDSIQGQVGIYGTKGIPAASNAPGARSRSVNWMDANGNLWQFGGQGTSGTSGSGLRVLSDMWKFNPNTTEWTWVTGDSSADQTATYGVKGVAGSANNPGGRNNSACWKDAAGNFWLFGGFGLGSSGIGVGQMNDLWKYDPSTNQWTWISGDTIHYQHSVYGTMGTPAAANKPGSRELTINWTDASGKFWMFGGTGYNSTTSLTELLNELWRYDPSTGQWTWMKGDTTGNKLSAYGTKGTASIANNPGGRQGSPGWVDGAGNFWTSGGLGYAASGASGRLSDIWKYTPATNEWMWVHGDSSVNKSSVYGIRNVADTANKPGGRSGHVAWIDGTGNAYLFGGFGIKGAASGYENDLWKLVPDSASSVSVAGELPEEIILYPNPTSNGLYVKWKAQGKVQWQIADITGKVLVEPRWTMMNANSLFIDVSPIPAGIYYLQIQEEGRNRRQFSFLRQ